MITVAPMAVLAILLTEPVVSFAPIGVRTAVGSRSWLPCSPFEAVKQVKPTGRVNANTAFSFRGETKVVSKESTV
jgi:hypothetical protein